MPERFLPACPPGRQADSCYGSRLYLFVLCLLLLPFFTACAAADLVVPDVRYQPTAAARGGGKSTIVLASADFRQNSQIFTGSYSFIPTIGRLHMRVGGSSSGLLKPHEALRAALKARLKAQGYTVLAPGDSGAEHAPVLVACLYILQGDNSISPVSRADVAFTLVRADRLGASGNPGRLSTAHTRTPCASSVGMASASRADSGDAMEAALSEALSRAVDGAAVQTCLRR